MDNVAFKTQISSQGLQESSSLMKTLKKQAKSNEKDEKSFIDHLSEGIKNVNHMQAASDKMATNLATGKTENIHETMLALSQAEISFKLMVQVRNKALDAYQEIMRMQV